MTKRLFALITGVTGAVSAAACAVVSYLQPAYTPAIIAAIGIADAAVTEILTLFINDKED